MLIVLFILGIFHSFLEVGGDGVVLLGSDFVRKDEKKDERVERLVDMIKGNYEWSNHVWGVSDGGPGSEMVESEEEKEEEGDADADTEIGESSHVTPDVDSGKKKRKNADQGADARKKKLLCQLAASNKGSGSTDTDMKQFFEGLLKASFTAFDGKIVHQFSDRIDKIETAVTSRLGKLESEVSQLRTAFVLTEMAGKTDQHTGPSKTGVDTAPAFSQKDTVLAFSKEESAPAKTKKVTAPAISKKDTAPAISKKDTAPAISKKETTSTKSTKVTGPQTRKVTNKRKELITDDPLIDLPRVNLTLSLGIDFHMSTQDYLQSCFPDLSQDTFVEVFDPSQPKTDDPLALSSPGTSEKIHVRELNDYQIARAGENDPDAQLVYVDPENFERLQEWQDLRTNFYLHFQDV
ncbi:unnamed protein product [Eruca vesicaria subsp. sativa]|uniref:Uncharacterized protein n=1 Tax=Eruca vesicaria subsp. sativa TaxID=29727 RepID=A0ABC8JX23_ERUVS|nr:unnamed protein product [Eruca vesicaria subsp. sativa]